MRYRITALFIVFISFFTTEVVAQTVIIDEDFSDGDFTNNPSWTDDEAKHIINTSNTLQLDAPEETGEAAIVTSSDAAYGEWQALIELEFNPSGSNLSRFYIISDSENLKGDLNGYFVQVGDTEDEVSLYRQDGNTTTKIIDGTDDLVNSDPVTVRIRVTRDLDGNWELFTDTTGGTSYTSQGTAVDETYTSSSYIGLFSDYTSTRHDLFEYNDIKVTRITPPLDLQSVSIEDNQSFDVTFNQDIDVSSIQNNDFSIDNGIDNPNNTSVNGQVVTLLYDTPLDGGDYTLTISDEIQSQSGNSLAESQTYAFSIFDDFEQGDIVISEFMFDPPPGDFNFDDEYIEIRNTTDKIFNLQNWLLGNNSSFEEISGDKLTLQANEYLVIAADSVALKQVFGEQYYVEPNNFPGLVNSGDAVRLQTAEGTLVDSLSYTSDWGGTDVALERRSASTSSIYQENWGDSPHPDGGTPGVANEVSADTSPPQLSDFTIVSKQSLKLTFDERLEQAGSFEISNNSIASVNQTAADTVELSLASNLQNAESYELSISDSEDIFGNTIVPTDTSFTFYQPSPVDSGDVAINEFMYAPPSESSEYIELYNHSDKSLDLQGWTLSDNRESFEGTISNNQFIVPPDSFVVIAPDNTIESAYSDIALVTMSDFPALNNGGDQIIIRDQNGVLLDSLAYTSDWGGDEIALERRTVDVSGTYQSNWGDAPNEFGTPGSGNEIEADQTAPNLTNLNITGSTSIEIDFNEPIQQQSLEDPNNYQLSGSIAIDQAAASGKQSVTLTLASALQNAVDYQLMIDGIQDIYGNSLSNRDTTFTYYEISAADTGDVFISEFMSVPPSGSTEYIELRNTTSKSFDLQDWTLNDNTGDRQTITNQQFVLPPDSAVVIAPDQTLLTDFPDIALLAMGSSFPSLNNSGDDIIIRTNDGTRLDSLQYSDDWGDDEVALVRRSFELSAIYQSNWGSAPNGFGTPGTKNEIDTDSESPTLQNLTIRNSQQILLTFSEYLDENSSDDPTNFSISGSSSISDTRFAAPDSIFLTLDSELQNATEYNLTIENIADLFGNSIAATDTSFTYYEVSAVDSGDVAINEFMYAPPSESSEYIELYNHSDKSLDLQDWTLSDNRDSFEATISNNQFIVPPDSFVVIAPDNTIESEYPDITLVTMSDFPALNNGGDQIIIRDQNGVLLDSLAYTSDWGGDEIALERRTVDVSGTYQSNWGDAPNEFGTPGSGNEIEADQTAPELASFAIENSSELSLQFSEQIDRSTVTNINNYQLSNSDGIAEVHVEESATAELSLESPLQNATHYTLTVENITDIFGNKITPIDTSFTYYETTSADSGDVFVNEFIFAPPSGSTEFIELYNPTDESFDLQGWTLSDNRGIRSTITESQFVVPPDSFVVIAPDNTLKTEFSDIALVTMSSFPALNNSGDDIIIRNENGTLLDSLRYTSEWGGDEVTLERRTINVAGTYSENWMDSPTGFGTPGAPNQVSADDTPPTFESVTAVDKNKIELTFSERIASAADEQNYQLSPSTGIQMIAINKETVTLFLEQELIDGESYEVTASNVSDIFGNTAPSATQSFEYLQIDEAESGQIVINEILYNPGSGDKADFIELHNTTDQNFDLTNWEVGDFSSETTIDRPLRLEAGEYMVLTGNQNFAGSITNAEVVDGFPSLNSNTPDDIYIRNQDGMTIDSLRYYQSWGGDTEGASLERKDPQAASNDASNWRTNSSNSGISAGAQNVTFQEDNNPPEIIFSKILSNNTYEVRFSEFIRLTDEVAFYSGEQQLQVEQFDSTNANVIFLESAAAQKLKSSNGNNLRAENLSDVKGNTTSSSDISIAQPLQQGDLIINEIMFNPLADADDNLPDQSEYIELRNTQDYAISLEGLFLHDEPDENGDVRDIQPVSTTAKWVPPQGHVLVHADEATTFEESQVATFFDLNPANLQSIMRANRSSLSLASSDDAIYIADSTGTAIDSVFYDESWHNPNIIDTRGIALERIAPTGPSNDDSNWGSNTTEQGGSPNNENSIYQENAEITEETGISFEPNPFSPDDDGHEDNLFINYKLDQQDYLIKVRIYDRYGRLVRTLADGEQAGFEGQLIWDGRKDDGSRNRIGIYIVIFEAYDSASGSDKTFKKTVVLARQLN